MPVPTTSVADTLSTSAAAGVWQQGRRCHRNCRNLLDQARNMVASTDLKDVRWNALAVAAAGKSTKAMGSSHHAAFTSLRSVQEQLARLPASIQEPMRWLVLVMVADHPMCHNLLQGMMRAIPDDFSVYHFDATSSESDTYLSYARKSWYSEPGRIVHRAFRVGSGCILDSPA